MPAERKEPRGSRLLWWGILAALALSFTYFVPYFAALNNPNEVSRVYQIRAFVELGKLSVDEQVRRYGWVNDLAKRDGKLYTGKAPGTTFIGVPIYAALRAVQRARGVEVTWLQVVYSLRLFGALLPCLLFLHAFRGFVRRIVHDGHVASVLTVLLGLGTMFLPYALLFVNHSLTAATAFGTVIAVQAALRARSGARWRSRLSVWLWFGVAGLLLASTTALDYALFPISIALLVFTVARAGWSWSSVLGTSLGASVPTVLTAAYHQVCWGSPFRVSMSFLANPTFAAEADKGMFGVIGPTAASVWGTLLAADKGLLYFSPVLAVGLVAVVATALASRHSKEAVLGFGVTLWMLLYGTSLINWSAGWTVGPRYVTVIVPFVVFAIALLWAELGRGARSRLLVLVVGLGIPSVVVTAATSVMFPHLQPEYANPVFECIWPLWRDGLAPHTLGGWLFGSAGRVDQAVYLVLLSALAAYCVAVVVVRVARRSRVGAGFGAVMLIGLAALTLWLQSLPETVQPRRVESGNRWLRERVWEPAPPGVKSPVMRRPRR